MALECPKISLKFGSTGDKVSEMQKNLQTLGFYTGYKVDGSWGSGTESAVKAFQKRYGLKVDGLFGEISCNKLNSLISTLEKAETGKGAVFDCSKTDLNVGSKDTEKVLILQKYLKDWGYYCSACKIDGIYGEETKKAVAAFQTDNPPLSSDGWFGAKTCPVFVKKVNAEKEDQSESHVDVMKDFLKYHPHLRGCDFALLMYPSKILIVEEEVEVVEEVEDTSSDTSSTDVSTEDTDDTSSEETEDTTTPQVTKTTIKHYYHAGLNEKTVSSIKGLNCSTVSLSQGSSGSDVQILQTGLASLGFYTNSIDSSFGPKTDAAVRAFQRSKGLSDDGVVGPKTCPVFNEAIGVKSNPAKGDLSKASHVFQRDIVSVSLNADADGLTREATVKVVRRDDTLKFIRKMQLCGLRLSLRGKNYRGSDGSPVEGERLFVGYVKDIKLVQENNLYLYELSIEDDNLVLQEEVAEYKGTKKQTEHLKALAKLARVELVLDVSGMPDEEFEVNAVNSVGDGSGGSGSGRTVQMSNNDCNPNNRTESDTWADHRCNPPRCTAKSKVAHGNSSRSYATDTASHNSSAKELVEFVEAKCQYQYYGDNPKGSARCPEAMWNAGKSGKIVGNCADFARMMKCIFDVNGYKAIICHIPGHFYNAVWENGGWTVVDICARTCWGLPSYGHANHGNVKPTGTWDNPQPRLWY